MAEKHISHNHACVLLYDGTGLYKGQKYYQSKKKRRGRCNTTFLSLKSNSAIENGN